MFLMQKLLHQQQLVMTIIFYELQVDNMPFALDAYNLSSSHQDDEKYENITIYPNPI